MKRVLVGLGALAALMFGGYVIGSLVPHTQGGVVAVAPPSPIPGVTPVLPSPFASPSPSAVVAPTASPSPSPTPAPSATPVSPSPPPPPAPSPTTAPSGSQWTSLGLAGTSEVWFRCEGHIALFVTSGEIAAVTGGC